MWFRTRPLDYLTNTSARSVPLCARAPSLTHPLRPSCLERDLVTSSRGHWLPPAVGVSRSDVQMVGAVRGGTRPRTSIVVASSCVPAESMAARACRLRGLEVQDGAASVVRDRG